MEESPPKNRKGCWLYALALSVPLLAVAIFVSYRVYSVTSLQSAMKDARYVGFASAESRHDGTDWDDRTISYLSNKAEKLGISFGKIGQERLRAVLLTKIDAIGIADPGGFAPGFESALARFPKLRLFDFMEMRGGLTEADMSNLLAQLRRMERLETVAVFGVHLTDASVAMLAGHPSLQKVEFGAGITPDVVTTLKTLPALKEVTIHPYMQRDGRWRLTDTQKSFTEALPGVKVVFKTR